MCIRCMRFVYSQVHGVYILYTVIFSLLRKDNTLLSHRKNNTLTNKQFEQ